MTTNDTENSDDWYQLQAGAFPLVPRGLGDSIIREPLAFPAVSNAALAKHHDVFESALLILSQSGTGRKLIATAAAEGYAVEFDPPVIGGAGNLSDETAFGSTDHVSRRINLKGNDDPLALALTLAHEMTHVSQIVRGNAPATISRHHPQAMLRLMMVMEADARAHEFAVAFELAFKKDNEPEQRLLFPQAIDAAVKSIDNEMTKRVVTHFRPQFPDVDKEEMMARVFKAFYASPSKRLPYEATVVNSIMQFDANNPGDIADETNFTRGVSVDELLAVADATTPYASRFKKYLDLDDKLMQAVWPETLQRLAKLQEPRRENAITRDERAWNDAPDITTFFPKNTATPQNTANPKAPAP